MSNELCYLSAVEAIQLFSSGELSPVELLQAQIERAQQVEPEVNALVYTFYDEAMDMAKAAEKAYQNGTARPLEGITLAVKDELAHKGKPNSHGSLLLKDHVSDSNAPMMQRLLDAGAIPHARTATPEFCMHSCTMSKLWGVTRNPWNLAYSPGGSSGGSGAALASGTTTIATGSDIAGSIRIPASQNGIVGYKPPFGRVPQSPPWSFDTYCHEGPMARTVADTILFQNQINGPHPSDIASLSPKLILPNSYDNIAGMRIAYSLDFEHREVDNDIRENTLMALQKFRDLGAIVEEVSIGWTKRCRQTYLTHLYFYAMGILKKSLTDAVQYEQLTSYVRFLLEQSNGVSIPDIIDAKQHEGEMYQQFTQATADYDLFICPTMATASFAADWDFSTTPLEINGKKIEPMFVTEMLTYYFNILSRCPVLNMPAGKDRNNVPTGIQIVGKAYDEHTVFRAASAYEAINKPFFATCDYPKL
ncbi:amidase [Dasania sp. GY-MA-18]|uniref:Amidase n=1 Tax=Dasania phycosphaerae TaxID=2950436 RepID=A0A9J6RLX5_9GAMM|nr:MULTISPECIES: amidase [Dasania]MCR8923083.1 amidase [Dasania sp. GY-MA-18]MCZ0865515.1 amidase [Dasania phycosphaerae]MCZ0869240.1 amidase [Dasania phycosphaerae]